LNTNHKQNIQSQKAPFLFFSSRHYRNKMAQLRDSGDFDKLQKAFQELTSHLSSVDDFLEAIGLANLPPAQRYGIMFGCLTFVCTVGSVICLLILGGSFKRMAEQSTTGQPTLVEDFAERANRPLLLEQLLEARLRLLKKYPETKHIEGSTELTKMLLNVAPSVTLKDGTMGKLVEEDGSKNGSKGKKTIPDGYKENYVVGYRRCQDRPGGEYGMIKMQIVRTRPLNSPFKSNLLSGPVLSGRPEARFEAYARAYAGCGLHTKLNYRRSYARLYESVSCATLAAEEKFRKLWMERPQDIVGRSVRLEALEVDRHLQAVYDLTSGKVNVDSKSFDPLEIWGFLEAGPFDSAEELRKSFVFQRKFNEAAFCIIHGVTDRVMGVVLLTNDDPWNLTIHLETPIVKPSVDGSLEQLEACFLLMDRLFGYGYRRIQLTMDSQDTKNRKLAVRLGFTQEGMLPKHMVIKEASRDSSLYGMLNSDWDRGARSALFKKLHGVKAQRIDDSFNRRDEELDEQQRKLEEKKREEAMKDKNA
jgi:RimJ/RimL family protein N-acetyltransferase